MKHFQYLIVAKNICNPRCNLRTSFAPCSSIEEAATAALALTSDLLQAHSLYSARMNAPDAGDNSLAVDEKMLLDVELLDWFFSKVSSVVIERNYR